jgi:hypothetical protein
MKSRRLLTHYGFFQIHKSPDGIADSILGWGNFDAKVQSDTHL